MCSAPDPDAPPRGRFVTIEGGEGAGKSTQCGLLAAALRDAGHAVLETREPGGTQGAERLRALLLEPGGATPGFAWSPLAETLLHLAARAEHVAVGIRPALAGGEWVVCDRYSDSTRAYQGGGQGVDDATIVTLGGAIGLVPDLTIVLDVSEETRLARLAARGARPDRYESLPTDFHQRVRQTFQRIACEAPARCVLLSAEDPVQEVHRRILALVRARLPA